MSEPLLPIGYAFEIPGLGRFYISDHYEPTKPWEPKTWDYLIRNLDDRGLRGCTHEFVTGVQGVRHLGTWDWQTRALTAPQSPSEA